MMNLFGYTIRLILEKPPKYKKLAALDVHLESSEPPRKTIRDVIGTENKTLRGGALSIEEVKKHSVNVVNSTLDTSTL